MDPQRLIYGGHSQGASFVPRVLRDRADVEAGVMLAGPNPGHQTLVLPCITHALNCVSEPDWQLVTEADVAQNVADEVAEAVVEFLGP